VTTSFIQRRGRAAFWLVCAIVNLCPAPARAEDPPLSDLAGREPVVADLAPRVAAGIGDTNGPSTVSLSLATRRTPARRDYAGTLMLTLPTDFFTAPPRKAKRMPEEFIDDGGESPLPPGLPRVIPRSERALPPLRPGDARAAVSAAEDMAGVRQRRERIDDLAMRARWSALLPQLRLRATRLIDESQSLSPTSYDPSRTTNSGGASLWLEARTTWHLDRLLFASEEVRIERLRQRAEVRAAQTRVMILELLGRWSQALLHIRDPALDSQQCLVAELEAEHLAAMIDVLTQGWFAKWRARSTTPLPRCFEQDEDGLGR
jgi:hypothetical protein